MKGLIALTIIMTMTITIITDIGLDVWIHSTGKAYYCKKGVTNQSACTVGSHLVTRTAEVSLPKTLHLCYRAVQY